MSYKNLTISLMLVVLLAALAAVAYAQQPPKIKEVAMAPTSPASGHQMYTNYCAVCHGVTGVGNGPAAPALKKVPTDLTQLSRRNNGAYPAIKVSQSIRGDNSNPAHGSKDMPVWGELFSTMSQSSQDLVLLRLANLTDYIQTLQK